MAKIRTFIAVQLPENILSEVEGVQQALRRMPIKLRWVRPENMHLTLNFLGDIEAAATDGVFEAMAATVEQYVPLSLGIRGLGVFPGVKRPRVLWAGLAGQSGDLVKLQQALENRLAAQGIIRNKKAFKGHLTIARMKGPVDSGRLVEAMQTVGRFETAAFTVDRLILYKSDLTPSGPIYTALKTACFTGSPA